MPIKKSVQKMLKNTTQGSGKDKLWLLMDEKRQMGYELRRPYERNWVMNLSFIAGKQYTFYNKTVELVQHLVQRKGRLRVVDNKLLPKFQKQVSRMIRNHPRMSVIPSSTDSEDIKAAKKGDKVIKWWWRSRKMRKKVRETAGWIYGTGNCFLDDRWNPKLGPMVPDDSGTLRYLGDADVGVWSPFDMLFPAVGMASQEIDDFPWMGKDRFRSLEYIRANYKRGKEVAAENQPALLVDTAVLFGETGGSASHKFEGARLLEIKIKPSYEYPKGKFLVGANGVVLIEEDYPYDSYHVEHFKDIDIPGVFYGMATTEAAIHLQKIHNRTLSDITEYNRVMARGKWSVPRGSRMEVDPDDAHGQKIVYTPVMGHKPEMMTIKGLPASYTLALEQVAQSLMELYHQHEVTSGTNKSDIRSGEMVALLLEQDDFGNVPTHAILEESLEAVMSRVLQRIQKGYTEDRVVSITGRDGAHEVFAFKGADLRNNTDVHVAKESSIPDSKVARQARIMNNFEKGLYGRPEEPKTRERVLKMLDEVPDDIKDIFAEDSLDRTNAEIENRAIMSNPEVLYLVNTYDNHAVHTETHRMARKQPEYQRLKMENPQAFTVLETCHIQHDIQHMKFLQEERKQQMAEMAKMDELKGGGK